MKDIYHFLKLSTLLATWLICVSTPSALAEDIELYVNNQLEETENARVMLVFDTSGSMGWSINDGKRCYDRYDKDEMDCVEKLYSNGSPYKCRVGYEDAPVTTCPASRLQVAKEAITSLIDNLDGVDLGLSRFYSGSGGYIVADIGSSKEKLKTQVNNFPSSGSTPLTETVSEIYRYFSGGSVNYAKNRDGRDKTIESNGKYISPFANLVDGKYQPRCYNDAFVVIITDGDPTSDSGANTTIKNWLYAKENVYPSEYKGSHLPNLARYMAQYDVYSSTADIEEKVRTFTIGFGTGMSDNGKAILEKAADKEYGNGDYVLAENANQLNKDLKAVFNTIREINGTFSSPSVATSQSDNTRSKDSIYYAMFLPNSTSAWNGNIKKLKVSGTSIIDQTKSAAIDANNGAIKQDAKTFWTTFGASQPGDGSNVMSGGLNQWIKAPNSRAVFTDIGKQLQPFVDSSSDVVSLMKTAAGVDEQGAKELINWSKGSTGTKDSSGNWQKRDHIMGDPLHSKPAAINYDINGEAVTHLLFGTNAGYVHMFSDDSDTQATEKWSFIPNELYKNIPKLKDEVIGKVYGMDLSPTVHFKDSNGDGMVNGSDKVWAFFGMRRGGSSYYALDITNPSLPTFLWKKSNADTGFSGLGQTWSEPKVIYVNHSSYADKPLLVFGAGFDNEYYEEGAGQSVGAGIYLVDAETGDLVWSSIPGNGISNTNFPGTDSITGSIATLDSDYDGYVDRLYASDVGGNVWRFDLPGSEPFGSEPWSVFKLASIASTGSNERKFFYQPEVSRTYFSKVTEYAVNGELVNVTRKEVPFEAVVVGSGDRTNPLGKDISNHLYMIRDENVLTESFKSGAPDTIQFTDLMKMTPDTFGNLLSDYNAFVEQEHRLASFKGWYYQLGATEKALASPSVIGGVAYFPTFTPGVSTSNCSLTGGLGALYAFNLHYGVKVYNNIKFDAGDTIPPTPQLVVNDNSDGKSQFLLIGVGTGDGSGVIKAKAISDSAVPKQKCDANGANCEIDLTGEFAGFETRRSYIYRESENKVN
ncbi:PilC/PilY family type IV pilus protein [Pseudoalteromonas sp. MMG024]|uniref:pilus assembly protein n=1 Tax=Pseudoalteromonas sp. MMG024 TaxID=2909980 RepID=UPI001F317472|nr:PilC/PilY family type IV pilus protein [Pseudoalteromonas sp. MMG024]MCF6457113.1 pilin biogenesis protein [Pseudoalteromonas sp. MMG024]